MAGRESAELLGKVLGSAGYLVDLPARLVGGDDVYFRSAIDLLLRFVNHPEINPAEKNRNRHRNHKLNHFQLEHPFFRL